MKCTFLYKFLIFLMSLYIITLIVIFKFRNSVITFLCFERFPPQSRKYTVCPIICGNIQAPEHLRSCDRFWVHAHLSVRRSESSQGSHQSPYAVSFTTPSRSQRHNSMTNQLRFIKLHMKKKKRGKVTILTLQRPATRNHTQNLSV